uniref:PorP/SprF family type IX secretion system membrane protein n=1 Tax=Algoriphagus sp. TaxID=1872435 RepID=UPI0040473116
MRGLLLCLFSFYLATGIAWGQDVQYSQYYANPIYLNPALVGSTDLTRIGVNFRNQWPALDQTFFAYTAYADHYNERLNSGVGLILQGANESFTETSWNEVGLAYSYRLQLSSSSFIQSGMQGSFISRDAAFGRVVLGSQLDIDRGQVDLLGSGLVGESVVRTVDSHAGLVYYGRKVWLGVAVSHLLQPNISYLDGGTSRLPRKLSLHGGYRFDLAPGYITDYLTNAKQDRSLSVGFNYKEQGQFSQLDLGAEVYFEPLAFGLWYRGLPTKYGLPNHESLVTMVGLGLNSGLDVGYSFDFPISSFGLGRSGGSHELSVRFVFSSLPAGKVRYRSLPSFRY